MDSFLEAIDSRQGVTIYLGNQPRFVARCRFGLHLNLAKIAEETDGVRDARVLAGLILVYLKRAGLSRGELEAAPLDLLEAYIALRRLNTWQWVLPWLKPDTSGREGPPKPIYDYEGRWWATWIHKLASRYGWSRDEILDLWPEEAAVYFQEILVSEYLEMEDRRALSRMSYKYEEVGNRLRFVPLPKPSWMVDEDLPKAVRVPRAALPVGNVVR